MKKSIENAIMGMFTNSNLLIKAVEEDMAGNHGRPATEATDFSYEHFEEYISFICIKRLVAEGFSLGENGWCYAGYSTNEDSYYKLYFIKHMEDGYEVVEFLVSQFEFEHLFPNTYPIIIPLILRENNSYIPGNTISECVYRIFYTDHRGIKYGENNERVYNLHFSGSQFKDETWYRIVDSINYIDTLKAED